jgi:hypothetical protein
MTLREVVSNLSSYDREQTIFVDRSAALAAESTAIVAWIPEDNSKPEGTEAMRCFLDVWHAIDVIEGKARLHSIESPTVDQKLRLLLDYAANGA